MAIDEAASPLGDASSEASLATNLSPSFSENNPPMLGGNEGEAPRLMITKMVLENFKSYAGVQEIGPFHHRFSSVVGPNGSGKSNVIDAMLFVFGKRAKKLRLNKVRELIHRSPLTVNNPPKFARVAVHMQEIVARSNSSNDGDIDNSNNDDGYDVVPGTEVVVARTAKEDNSSTYQLNGKTVQFREVAKFLGSKGIDLDNNRFLILQGEVEMISMMPPKGKTENDEGLLEYLEDIIGSSKYVEQTNEAAQQVEALTEQRQERLNRCKAVEKEKDGLEGAKLEAESLLHKNREIRRKQNILYQILRADANREAQEWEPQRDQVAGQLEKVYEELNEAEARVKEIQSGLEVELRRAHQTAYAELEKAQEEFKTYERKDIQLQSEIKHSKATKKKLQKKVMESEEMEAAAIKKGKDAEESIPELEEKIEELSATREAEGAKLEEVYQESQQATQQLRGQLEAKSQELAPVKQERSVFQGSLDTAQTQVDLLKNATQRSQEKLDRAEKELDSLDAVQQSKREEYQAAQEELETGRARIEEAVAEEKVLADKEAQLGKKHKDLLIRLEEAKASLQSNGTIRSPAVKGILKAARKGGELAKVGVLGRLGDLASVAPEYDVAVSTACGMLDYIVVQTTAGAQRCLEFLRKHKLGRANFIPLDKQKKGTHDRVVETPEGAPRLFELITPVNGTITPAIFLAVTNTLVAPDMETASRWAYDFEKRWRVVTLDGKLIETAGTMSGGGKSVRKGGMKLSNGRARSSAGEEAAQQESLDCKELEKEVDQAQQLLQQIRGRRKELNAEIRSIQKRLKELEGKLPKLDMEITDCDTTRQNLTKMIPVLRSETELSDEDASKLEELEGEVEKCKAEMASCAELASRLEKEVGDLQKAILDAGGKKLKKQQAVCDKVMSNLKSSEKALKEAQVAVTSSVKAADKARNAKITAEKQLEECIVTLEEKVAESKDIEDKALEVAKEFERVKAEEAEKREALESVKSESDALKKSQSKIRCTEIELKGKIDSFNKSIADCEAKKTHWTKEIEKLHSASDEDDYLSDDEDDMEDGEEGPEAAEDEKAGTAAEGEEDVEMADAVSSKETEQTKDKSSLPTFSDSTLEKYDKGEVKSDIAILEKERDDIAKSANMGAIAEYRKKESDYLARVAELDAVTEERNAARAVYEDLRRKRLDMFMDGFGQITLKLKEMYQMITLGGDAELELVDSLDPFSEGIVFSVRPPKKSWKNISNLSGGEKTLSSLALVFALHHFKPTPLYVMDEIDAALDFKNVSIVANYIKERTKNAQFIIISLRNNMFELADRLVGIYKTNNATKSVTINPMAFGVQGQENGFGAVTPAPLRPSNAKGLSSAVRASGKRRLSLQSQG